MMTNAAKHSLCRLAARQIALVLKWLQQMTGDTVRSVSIQRDRDTMRSTAGKMQMDVIVDLSEGV